MKNTSQLEVIGIMSGTSLDGLDLAWCRFHHDSPAEFELLEKKTLDYPDRLQTELARAVNLGAEDLLALDAELGTWFGHQVRDFIGPASPPDLIASHGHTVFHQPDKGFTLQIGNGAQIHAVTGLPVVNDFRSLDVALGGQGAPLVPIGDKLLFGQYDYCINLGGIANISWSDSSGNRLACDLTFCNMVLNRIARQLGQTFDENGALARSGNVNDQLREELDNWAYYALKGPRSLGYEEVSRDIFPLVDKVPPIDSLRTCTEHIAERILQACTGSGSMLITGGGAHNAFLREGLAAKEPNLSVVYPEKWLVDYKEAIVFAFLGALRVWGKTNILASVTGAKRDSSSGNMVA